MKNRVRERNTDKLATVCNDNVRPYSRGYICHIGVTRSERKKDASVRKSVCVCAFMTLCERDRKKIETQSKKP